MPSGLSSGFFEENLEELFFLEIFYLSEGILWQGVLSDFCMYAGSSTKAYKPSLHSSHRRIAKLSVLPVLPLGHEADGVFMIRLPD